MLIDILKMPPVFGIPIQRRLQLGGGMGRMADDIAHVTALTLGNHVSHSLRDLYKAIYLSADSNYIVEVVFSNDTPNRCLYVKMLYADSALMGIPVETLRYYNSGPLPLLPVSEMILDSSPLSLGFGPQQTMRGLSNVHAVVPPVYGEVMAWDHVLRILDIKQRPLADRNAILHVFYPLYDHFPGVMSALLDGHFLRSPMSEIQRSHPSFHVSGDRWFQFNEIAYKTQIMHVDTHVNHVDFDALALTVVMMPQTKFSYMTLLSYAIDGIQDVGDVRLYQDPYQFMLKGFGFDRGGYQLTLKDLLFKAVMAYCRLNGIDSKVYLENARDRSAITVTRNIYDEVSFMFHDHLHDKITCYYSTFPALALVTQAVGIHKDY